MKVIIEDNRIITYTEYNSDFVYGARKLNGKWTGSAWSFDVRDEDKVRELLLETYGEDGNGYTGELVTVQLELDELIQGDWDSIEMFGRVVARRASRDSRVKLHDSVIILKGGFEDRGGSVKYPSLKPFKDTILEIKDIPLNLYEKENKKYSKGIILIDKNNEYKKALEKEKEKLLARLEEIEKLLSDK